MSELAALNDRPIRIQRRRTPGWRMPANTVYVGRPTLWGNPFADLADGVLVAHLGCWSVWETSCDCVDVYRQWVLGGLDYEGCGFNVQAQRILADQALRIRKQLHTVTGHHLACWCSLEARCHADVLLELANERKAR